MMTPGRLAGGWGWQGRRAGGRGGQLVLFLTCKADLVNVSLGPFCMLMEIVEDNSRLSIRIQHSNMQCLLCRSLVNKIVAANK